LTGARGVNLPLRFQIAILILLCVLAYAPLLSIPLFEDDYPILTQSQQFGGIGGLPTVLGAPVYRARATLYWTGALLWPVFHLHGWAYHLFSLLLHAANTLLVLAVCRLWTPMKHAAFWAAAFFAVHEGHQEAIVWYSAVSELLVFLFGAASIVAWQKRRTALSLALFAAALLSKESAIILLPLFFLVDRRRPLPHIAVAAIAALSIAAGHTSSFRFADGSFSLHAPFWITWPRSYARLLWFWGWLALAALAIRKQLRPALPALAWIGLALIPYSFLTYSTQIPSRQVYLASFGLALLFGLAIAAWNPQPRVAAAVLILAVATNTGYLWTKKRRQYIERAAPTEQLIDLARRTPGPIWVRCFPRQRWTAEEAVRMGANRPPSTLVWSETEPHTAEFCVQ
jgi:hypothetical protein